MGNDEAILERWKALVGDTSPETWTEDDLAGYFQRFRPDGVGLSAVFEGVKGADEILPRLLEVYQATAGGWLRDDSHDGYFIVRNPAPLLVARATDLLRLHLDKLAAMSEAVGCDELTDWLRSPLRLEAVEGEIP